MRRDDRDMVRKAPLESSFDAPSGERQNQALQPFPYGIGIDCHSKFIQVCVRTSLNSKDVFDKEFPVDWKELLAAREWAVNMLRVHVPCFKDGPDLRYTIESTGCYHLPVIRAWAGSPSVVNPLLAAPTRRKTDKLDARLLAYHAITGLWPASFLSSDQLQNLRVMWNERMDGRRAATRCSNRINNVVLRYGHTYGNSCKIMDSHGRAVAEDLVAGRVPLVAGFCPMGLTAEARDVVRGLIANFDVAEAHAKEFEQLATAYVKGTYWPSPAGPIHGKELLRILTSTPGIGPITAIAWLCEIGDPGRFENAKQVAAFCGCDPSLKVSAGKVTRHVRRKGNKKLHQALLQAGLRLVSKHGEPFGEWGYAIARRSEKGGMKRGAAAVARRLGCALWHVHRTACEFSYEKYKILETPEVPAVELEFMGITIAEAKLLRAAGYGTSAAVAEGWYRGINRVKGVGPKCLEKLRNWLAQNKTSQKGSFLLAQCSVAPGDLSAKTKPRS